MFSPYFATPCPFFTPYSYPLFNITPYSFVTSCPSCYLPSYCLDGKCFAQSGCEEQVTVPSTVERSSAKEAQEPTSNQADAPSTTNSVQEDTNVHSPTSLLNEATESGEVLSPVDIEVT